MMKDSDHQEFLVAHSVDQGIRKAPEYDAPAVELDCALRLRIAQSQCERGLQ